MPYTPYYLGGWHDQPSVLTPVIAAALNTIDKGIGQAGAAAWYSVAAYGADPTGAAFSDTAFANAYAALPAAGGVLYMPFGTYKTQTPWNIPMPGVTIWADPGTVLNYWGTSGDAIRMYSTQDYTHGWGGGVQGLIIDGTHASAGCSGIHAGDIYKLRWDAYVRNFQGAGSVGIWLDNNYWFAEQMAGRLWGQKNTQNVVFDNSVNTGANATGSFARAVLDITLDCKGVGDGLTLQNGAVLYNHQVGLYGNMDYSASAAQHWALTITGSNSGGNSHMQTGQLNIGMECNATNANPAPGTINFGTAGSNYIRGCAGVIDFGAATAFGAANNWNGSFQFDGPVLGDALLKRVVGSAEAYFDAGAIGNNAFLTTRYNNLIRAFPSSNVTGAILGTNDPGLSGAANANSYCTVVNSGSGSITFDVTSTSHVATGTSCVIPAGQAMTFVWLAVSSTWYQVT